MQSRPGGSLLAFQFQSSTVRTIVDEHGEPLFVGVDVCDALGYANAPDAIKRHCKGVAKRYPLSTPAVALSVIERETGLHLDGFRAALPRNSEPMATMNATAVGRAIAEPAVTTNRLFERLGLQRRNARGEWELTETGKLHGEAYPYSNGKHSGYQILWKPSVVAILAEPEFELYLQ